MLKLRNFQAPPSFYEEETREGVLVPASMKQIWAVELDLLLEFQRICAKHELRYFAFGGTMLGAIRHHGFIPWDDDIDVAMPMNDYTRLQDIAKNEIAEPYCLQTPYLDPGSYFSFMKLRNSQTTFMSKVFQAQTFNQGAFIDIFPLVECPPEKMKEQREKIYPCIMRCSNYMKRGSESILNNVQLQRMQEYHTDDPMREYESIMREFCNPAYRNCGYYTHSSLFFDYNEYHSWKSDWWAGDVLMDFEVTKIPVPIGWKDILTEYYGNFMVMPPAEQRVSIHSNMIIDMQRPYTDYIKKEGRL